MWQIAVNNVFVDPVLSVIHTIVATNHRDQFVNQIHADQMLNALFKQMVNQFAIVHTVWAVMQIV